MTPADPPNLGTVHRATVRPLHSPRQTILHIPPQFSIHSQLGRLRTARAPVRMPLRRARPILKTAAASRSVTTQLAGDRRRRAAELPRDLPDPAPAGAQQSDLLPLGKRQVASRQRRLGDRRHPATLPEPSDANRRRDTGLHASGLARRAAGDRCPEPLPMLPAPARRPTRRPHRRPPSPIRPPPLRLAHRNSSRSSVATTA